ncbi:MAG: hypothetical protein QXU32_07030 [Nitrososphaerales archaeon]
MKIAVVLMGLLVLSAVALSNTSYAQRTKPTAIEFEMSGCTNSMTCGAELFVGDTVEFKGRLTTSDGDPIVGVPITVYKFVPTPELVTIASGVTGIDGEFDLTWVAEFTPTERAPNDVTRKFLTETVTIFAQFEGNEQYSSSRSGKNTATIRVNELITFVNSDKNLYRQGDSAIVFLGFIDSHDQFVDPDSIRVVLNDREVQVEKKKEGSYTLTIPALPKEHTQLMVLPKKEGYNVRNGFLTLIVDGLK